MSNLIISKKVFVTLLIFVFSTIISCAGTGRQLSTKPVRDKGMIQGTFTVVLYGGQYIDDFETVAFLDQEGDDYSITPFGEKYLYSMKEGMNGQDALQAAEKFLRFTLTAYNSYRAKQISGPDGSIIGYEIRPLMQPFVYGESDLLDISYSPGADREVTVYIRKKDSLDRLMYFRLESR